MVGVARSVGFRAGERGAMLPVCFVSIAMGDEGLACSYLRRRGRAAFACRRSWLWWRGGVYGI